VQVVEVMGVMGVIEGVSKGLTVLDKLVHVRGFICSSACAQLNCIPAVAVPNSMVHPRTLYIHACGLCRNTA
jgi:hypothetical protein